MNQIWYMYPSDQRTQSLPVTGSDQVRERHKADEEEEVKRNKNCSDTIVKNCMVRLLRFK